MNNNLRGIADLTESDGLPCEAKVLRDADDKIKQLTRERDALISALTPNIDTKREHVNEYGVTRFYDCDTAGVTVTWTTIKEIMKEFREHAKRIETTLSK